MTFKDKLAAARASRPAPVLQAVAVDGELFSVEVRRLDGMEWSGVTAECPPADEMGARLGYDTKKAALIACRRFSRLLDSAGDPVDMSVQLDENGNPDYDPWVDLFGTLAGVEVDAIAATWWALNAHDPNQQVVALKKALAAGGKTS